MAIPKVFNPFPGLRPFGAEEDYLFFGREDQTNELLQLLRTHRFIAVVGTSGSGKSSLVRAGVLPALYGGTMVGVGSQWETVVFRPGGDPLLNLARGMIDADLYDGEDSEAPLRIRATLSRSRLGLAQAVEQSDLAEEANLLIVVDQFEELFRFRDTTPEHQEMATAFVKLLLNAAADESQPIYVAITMRSDYLGDCAQIPGLAEAVNDGEYLIPKLTRDQRRDAIEKPTAVGGGKMSPALVQQLLNDVGDDADQLPILQHALMRIWDKWEVEHDDGESIGLRHYDLVGGLQSALSLHADEVFAELRDDSLRDLTQRVFQAVTEKGEDERGIRRPTRLDQLCEIVGGDVDDVVLVLDAYRRAGRTFVMPTGETELVPDTVVDISHESLMRVWERLKGWVDEESQSARIYRRLADTATLHADGRAGVYRDPDLQIASSWRETSRPTVAWADRYHPGLDASLAFLDKSWDAAHAEEEERERARQRELEQAQKLAEAERKRAEVQAKAKKRLYVLLAGISAALLVAIGMYLYAEQQRTLAEANRLQAVANEQRATANAKEAQLQEGLAKENAAEARRQEAKAKDNAAEAERQEGIAKENEAEAKSQAEQARQAREAARRSLYFSDMSSAIRERDTSRGGAFKNAAVQDWMPRPGEPDYRNWEWYYVTSPSERIAKQFDTKFWGAGDVVCAHNSSLLAIGNSASQMEIVDYRTNERVAIYEEAFVTNRVAFSRQDEFLISAGTDGVVRVVDPATGVVVRSYPVFRAGIAGLETARNSDRVAVQRNVDVRVVDLGTHRTIRVPLDNVSQNGWWWCLSPKGDYVAYTATDSRICIVPVDGAAEPRYLETVTERTRTLAWHPVEDVIAAIDENGVVRVLDIKDGSQVKTFEIEERANLNRASWSNGGELLAVGGSGGIAYCIDVKDGGDPAKLPQFTGHVWRFAWGHNAEDLIVIHGRGNASLISDPMNRDQANRLAMPGFRNNFLPPIDVTSDGEKLVYGDASGITLAWLDKGGPGMRIDQNRSAIRTVDFSPDGKYVAGAGRNIGMKIWDAESGEVVAEVSDLKRSWLTAWSPDGRLLACSGRAVGNAGNRNDVVLYDVTNPSEPVEVTRLETTGNTDAMAWSSDGTYLAASGFAGRIADARIFVFDVKKRARVVEAIGSLIFIRALAFVPGETILLAGGNSFQGEGLIDVVDFSGETPVVETTVAHFGAIVALDISPDGSRVVSGSMDRTLKLWDRSSMSEVAVLAEADETIAVAQFSARGDVIRAVSVAGESYELDSAPGRTRYGGARVERLSVGDDELAQFDVRDVETVVAAFAGDGKWDEATDVLRRYFEQRKVRLIHSPWWVSPPVKVDLDQTSSWEEDLVVFREGMSSESFAGRWRATVMQKNGVLDLAAYSDKAEFASVYAVRRVYAPAAGRYGVYLSSDDFHRVWLNGQQIDEHRVVRPARPDSDFLMANLQKGWNTFLFKVYNENGAFGAYLKVTSDPVELAKGLQLKGEYSNATRTLGEVLDTMPDAHDVRVKRVASAFLAEDYEQVVSDTETLLALAPESEDLRFRRAVALRQTGETAAALEEFSRCVEINPGKSASWIELARIQRELGNMDEAKRSYAQAIVASSGDSSVLQQVAFESEQRILVANSVNGGSAWRYTRDEPDDGWLRAEFLPAADWDAFHGGVASQTGPFFGGWKRMWLRAEFDLAHIPEGALWLHYGNGNVPVEAYVNGVLVSDFKARWFGNAIELGGGAARVALRQGKNVVAVYATSFGGGRVDLGLSMTGYSGVFPEIAKLALEGGSEKGGIQRFLSEHYARRLALKEAAKARKQSGAERKDLGSYSRSLFALYVAAGDDASAEAYLRTYLPRLPEMNAFWKTQFVSACLSFVGSGEFRKAVESAINDLPDVTTLHAGVRGLLAYRRGDYQEAAELLRSLQGKWDGNRSGVIRLASVATEAELGRLDAASVEDVRTAYRVLRAKLMKVRDLGQHPRMMRGGFLAEFCGMRNFAAEIVKVTKEGDDGLDINATVVRTYASLTLALLQQYFGDAAGARASYQRVVEEHVAKQATLPENDELRRLDATLLWALVNTPSNALPPREATESLISALEGGFASQGARWKVMKPVEVSAKAGTTLEVVEDGGILASGTNPPSETYEIVLESPYDRVTAFRLDTLPDASFRFGSSGRHRGGNYHVHSVQYFPATVAAEKPQALVIENTSVDWDQFGTGLRGISKPGPEEFWAIAGRYAEVHQAVFDLETPLEQAQGKRIRVEVTSDDPTWPSVAIGKMRFYANDAEGPITVRHYTFYDAATHTSAYTLVALLKWQAGDVPAATASAEKAVRMTQGGNAYDWMLLALAAQQAGELEAANTWFRKAVGWSSENATGEPIMNDLFRRYQRATAESN